MSPMKRGMLGPLLFVVGLVLALTSEGIGAAATSRGHTTAPKVTGSVTVLPVISCPTTYGTETNRTPFVPRRLPTTVSSQRLSFYSNGLLTVLGPSGWTCGALVAMDAGQQLDVYPPGKPNYSELLPPKGAELVRVLADYTGHLPGAQEVCALFPRSAAASEVESSGFSCHAPAAQKQRQLTPDVVTFSDPPEVTGTGAGSGGALTSSGAAVYPQLAYSSTASVDVSLLSCTLPKRLSSLCPAILGDFLVRYPPHYTATPSS